MQRYLLFGNHVSFGNIVFGLASAQLPTGFVGCALFSYEAKGDSIFVNQAKNLVIYVNSIQK